MDPQRVQRKLAAILSADVQGYSRLMGDDEVATVRTITASREVVAALVAEHRGRLLDATGDSLLAEFVSVVDAVQCALAIQEALDARNAALPAHRHMRFRIGINLGDVIVDGETIYGDGVNIAARLQALVEGGEVCVSGAVHDQIKRKLPLGYDYLGSQTVKNIAEPVEVYRVTRGPGASGGPAPRTRRLARRTWPVAVAGGLAMLLLTAGGWALWRSFVTPPTGRPPSQAATVRLPDRPSVAVLPFTNMSGDREQEYFSDGMTEEVITALSKLSGLFVIARNSVFTYKGKPVKVQEVARELGVQYVLEGSVRKAGKRIRITAQLVDAASGHHLWAERYDRSAEDIFALQDEITQTIVQALQVKLSGSERTRLARRYTESLEAYDAFLRGVEFSRRTTPEANARARQMFERAIALDPKFAAAYAWLGWTYWQPWALQWSQDPGTLDRAFELAQRAAGLDESLPEPHLVLGHVYLWKKQHDRAIAEAERALALDPNTATGHADLGEFLTWAGQPERAIGMIQEAMRLDPRERFYYLWALGHAYRLAGRYEEAVDAQEAARARYPEFVATHAELAVLYIELGREQEARAAVANARRLSPQASLETLRQSLPYKAPADLERYLNGLRKAGMV